MDDEHVQQPVGGEDAGEHQTNATRYEEEAISEAGVASEPQSDTSDADIDHREERQSTHGESEASMLSKGDPVEDMSQQRSEYTDSNADVSDLEDLQRSMMDGSRTDTSETRETREPSEVGEEESVWSENDDGDNTTPVAEGSESHMRGGNDTESISSTVRPSIEHDDDEVDSQAQDDSAAEEPERRASLPAEQVLEEESILSAHTDQDINEESFADDSELDHNDTRSHISRGSLPKDDGTESGSQHEGTDEDVFSDKSPRSSVGSCDTGSESGKRTAYSDDRSTVTRPPRVSDISQYDISQYDRDDFVPTARTTPRPRFRTTSDVRAMQMSSPSGSVYGGGSPRSPRSPKRTHPTVSRLGTPTSSTQYSPKKGSTPPRFKVIKEAPLILLHVTLVPLHWTWGGLVNSLNPEDLSDEMKDLRDSWRILQDRIGDTVVERGILLGHPQNDYELLEERLLEALELPQRKRARILECGHYLGASNDTLMSESEESEDESVHHRRAPSNYKRHWCSTCKNEIRVEELGATRVFRVKVYASNGLMRAGAWAACWKEMERVDAEIEPIVSPSLQDELVRLAAVQEERERDFTVREEQDIAREVAQRYEEERVAEEHAASAARTADSHPAKQQSEQSRTSIPPSEPASARESAPEPADHFSARSPPYEGTAQTRSAPRRDASAAPPSTRSASGETNARRDRRGKQLQGASFPELLLEAIKVLVQDRKNLVIVALSVIAVLFAMRSAPQAPIDSLLHEVVDDIPQPHATTAIHTQQIISEATASVQETPSAQLSPEPSVSEARVSATEPSATPAASLVPAADLELRHGAAQQSSAQAEVKKAAPLELDTEPFTPPPDHGLELVKSKSRKPVVLKETIKVYQTITQTQVEFETLVETIRVYTTETYEQQQPVPTVTKRLEIEG